MTSGDEGPQEDGVDPMPVLLIVSSLRILLGEIDKGRRLVEIALKERDAARVSLLQPLSRGISVSDRNGIEVIVRKIHEEMPTRVLDRLEQESVERNWRLGKESRVDGDRKIYPAAPEQIQGVMYRFVDEVTSAAWSEIDSRFGDDDKKYGYAAAFYISLSQPSLEDTLAESLFPTALSSFEKFLGGLVRTALTFDRADALGDLPDVPPTVALFYAENADTKDLKRWMIDRRVEAFVSGGYEGWREDIRRWLNLDLEAVGGDWAVIREATARVKLLRRSPRRLIDAEYLGEIGEQVRVAKPQRLTISHNYYNGLADEIETLALTLGLRWGQHFFPYAKANVSYLVDRVVRLENGRRWTQALSVSETLLDTYVHPDHASYKITQINAWFCRQELGTDDDRMRTAIVGFRPDDRVEEVGIAALRRDWVAMVGAIQAYSASAGKDVLNELRMMPLVKRAVREHSGLKNPLQMNRRVDRKARRRH